MLALVIVLLVVVALVLVVLTGLLRSHADILRGLHSLGAGVGDPSSTSPQQVPSPVMVAAPGGATVGASAASGRASAVHEIEGITPTGEPIVVSMLAADLTLLVFVSSGCQSCAALWASLGRPDDRQRLATGTRVVVVTKGPETESPANVSRKAPAEVTVVMSTSAWSHYEVPGSPYFVLVDGQRQARAGEGVGRDLAQVANLVGRASADEAQPSAVPAHQPRALGLDGAAREEHNDKVLESVGIMPGHPSLYPRSLDDVLGPNV